MFIVITFLIMLNLVQALCAKEPVEFSYQPVSGSQYQQKISNFELQRLISRATPIPNYMIHMQRSIQQKVTNLKKNGLSEAGVNLVVGNNMLDYLNYKTSGLQANQLLRIISHINDLGQLKQTYANNHDLNVLCAESLNFTNFANNANRENLVVLSNQFLEIAKQLFSVAKGIGCGVYRNLASYADMALHPIDTACDLYHVATNIGIGIVRALNIYQKVCLAKLVKDPKLSARHQQDVGRYVNEWREFYDYHIQNFLDKTRYASKQDRCEFIGERVADIIFLIGGGEFLAGSKAVVPWAQLANRPRKLASNFSRKFGQFGCQINRTVGTVVANGKKYVQRSNELKLVTGEIDALNYMDVVKRVCDCPVSNLAHDIVQYENLKNMLKIKEFTSVIKVTKHGLQRLIERGFTGDDVKELVFASDIIRFQPDNAKVFIKRIAADTYNVLVLNQEEKSVVSAVKNINEIKMINMGKNHGWNL